MNKVLVTHDSLKTKAFSQSTTTAEIYSNTVKTYLRRAIRYETYEKYYIFNYRHGIYKIDRCYFGIMLVDFQNCTIFTARI